MTWVNAKDKLPELTIDEGWRKISETVLVHDKYGNMYIAYLTEEEIWGEYSFVWREFGPDSYISENITHWQLLPKKPKAE